MLARPGLAQRATEYHRNAVIGQKLQNQFFDHVMTTKQLSQPARSTITFRKYAEVVR
jgi:hypothetical protein